jgi:hypothetical protein
VKKDFLKVSLIVMTLCWCAGLQALPKLQIGPGDSPEDWGYDSGTMSWVYFGSDSPFSLTTMAKASRNYNNGSTWDSVGALSTNRYAYLVVATLPGISEGVDGFDVTVSDDNGMLTMVDADWGAPPINDPNDLPPHSIFSTYFEIFEFQFDDDLTSIWNTEPGESGTGSGWVELLDITVNSLSAGVTDIHFDLFTSVGARWDPAAGSDRDIVQAFAPPSHDGETGDRDCCRDVSEPGTLGLMMFGLFAAGASRVRRRAAVQSS